MTDDNATMGNSRQQAAQMQAAPSTIDPDWEASLREQERTQVRLNALGYAVQSCAGEHLNVERIVARAKIFEIYLLGDQS